MGFSKTLKKVSNPATVVRKAKQIYGTGVKSLNQGQRAKNTH